MRLFIGLALSAEARAAIAVHTAALHDEAPRARWSPPSNYHVTLHFLGATDVSLVAPLGEALDAVAARREPITLEVGRLGGFPSLARARVLWLDILQGRHELEALYQDLAPSLTALGLPLECRPYRPHVTLARMSSRRPSAAMTAWAEAPPEITGIPTTFATEVHLYESRSGPHGVQYVPLHSAPFKA